MVSKLTDKQREVFDLLLEQQTSKEIARALKISPAAVELRIGTARRAMGGLSRREATLNYARELAGGATLGDNMSYFLVMRLSKRKTKMSQHQPANASVQRLILWALLAIGSTVIALQMICIWKH